jgi:hypothetical protein
VNSLRTLRLGLLLKRHGHLRATPPTRWNPIGRLQIVDSQADGAPKHVQVLGPADERAASHAAARRKVPAAKGRGAVAMMATHG